MNKKQLLLTKALYEIKMECENLPDKQGLGEKAMQLIGDYPLYASGLSNITYGEAIAIAMLLHGDIESAIADGEKQDELMAEYFKTDRQHSLADFDKWVKERENQ